MPHGRVFWMCCVVSCDPIPKSGIEYLSSWPAAIWQMQGSKWPQPSGVSLFYALSSCSSYSYVAVCCWWIWYANAMICSFTVPKGQRNAIPLSGVYIRSLDYAARISMEETKALSVMDRNEDDTHPSFSPKMSGYQFGYRYAKTMDGHFRIHSDIMGNSYIPRVQSNMSRLPVGQVAPLVSSDAALVTPEEAVHLVEPGTRRRLHLVVSPNVYIITIL